MFRRPTMKGNSTPAADSLWAATPALPGKRITTAVTGRPDKTFHWSTRCRPLRLMALFDARPLSKGTAGRYQITKPCIQK
jgi:hypothetical protein